MSEQVIPISGKTVCGSCGENYFPKEGHSCRPELPKPEAINKKEKVRTKTPKVNTHINNLNSLSTKYWEEFKKALLKDLPPFMLPEQTKHIIESHKAAFDMGCMSILDGIKTVAEEAQIQS